MPAGGRIMFDRCVAAFILPFILFAANGCSVRKAAIGMMVPSFEEMSRTVEQEYDLDLVREGLPANILTLEGMLAGAPDNVDLGLLVMRTLYSYAFAFIEDEDARRAKGMYEKSKDLGFTFLEKEGLRSDLPMEAFLERVSFMDEYSVPLLFWTANCWGSWVNLSRDNPAAIIQLPKVEAIMKRVVELDDEYYFGGGHLVLGVLNASRPRMLGGDPELAGIHFERALEISARKFLLIHLFYARYYCIQVMDQELFEDTIQEILTAPDDLFPDQRLANEVAKVKARHLLDEYRDYF